GTAETTRSGNEARRKEAGRRNQEAAGDEAPEPAEEDRPNQERARPRRLPVRLPAGRRDIPLPVRRLALAQLQGDGGTLVRARPARSSGPGEGRRRLRCDPGRLPVQGRSDPLTCCSRSTRSAGLWSAAAASSSRTVWRRTIQWPSASSAKIRIALPKTSG